MAIIRAFKAIRPDKDKAHKVAALPYDVMNSDEAREMVYGNPYSFLHVDKAEIDLPLDTDIYDKKVYEKAQDTLNKMLSDGVLVQDNKPCFYIYRLIMNGRSQTGLVVCTSIDEYKAGIIKRHELTRSDKEQDRINHVDFCNANTGPIFLAYKGIFDINEIIMNWTKNHDPLYDFISDDGISHICWKIDDDGTIEGLIEKFKAVPALYIADGHHRNASAVKVGEMRRLHNPGYTGEEEFNYYLSVIFDAAELKILDYNRVVKDLNGLSEGEFLTRLKEKFFVEDVPEGSPYKPAAAHEFGMYMKGKWFKLKAKENIIPNDPVGILDVSILQENVLIPILGIKDIKTDKRIDFIGGIRGLSELEKRVDSGEMKVAFSMYPTSLSQLMDIADAGAIMPPKSTWFEPKLRSGLFIHSLK